MYLSLTNFTNPRQMLVWRPLVDSYKGIQGQQLTLLPSTLLGGGSCLVRTGSTFGAVTISQAVTACGDFETWDVSMQACATKSLEQIYALVFAASMSVTVFMGLRIGYLLA